MLMITPAMVCGPFMRVAHAGSGMSEQCHEQKTPDSDHSLKFFKDCYGVELQQADTDTALAKPDFTVEKISFPWMIVAANDLVRSARFYDSHGPPYGHLSAIPSKSPVFLQTGRLRL
ncbi:MAG: hypothetical protein EP349_01890 [Alphaproteobacteria bacterium]|nr:MAG: hypothetical protein EP349_01890 [Alphaproteobacteria bacterium]